LSGYAGGGDVSSSSEDAVSSDEEDRVELNVDMSADLTEREIELALEHYMDQDVSLEQSDDDGTPPKIAAPPSA
jgi:3-methyladenine DNA glycosylase/8-oxoguanine DNA glycosylase